MTNCITPDELLRLARVAAQACGWPESAVRLVKNVTDRDLPAVTIYEQECWAFTDSRGDVLWGSADASHEEAAEALAETFANAAYWKAMMALYPEARTETVAT